MWATIGMLALGAVLGAGFLVGVAIVMTRSSKRAKQCSLEQLAASQVVQIFKDSFERVGAINFLQWRVLDNSDGKEKVWLLTVQPEEGKSPAELVAFFRTTLRASVALCEQIFEATVDVFEDQNTGAERDFWDLDTWQRQIRVHKDILARNTPKEIPGQSSSVQGLPQTNQEKE